MPAQHLRYSTYDWQQQAPISSSWSEAWSDVKTPGDGRTYAVGTTFADHTLASVAQLEFSGATSAGVAPRTLGPTGMPDAQNRIVAILQVTDAQGVIVWQRFFHGDGGSLSDAVQSTYARSISVFPGATAAETRIAICGETYDQRLPLSAVESGLISASAGFVAVYDGEGELRWTQIFYGYDVHAGTVITDVAIHVDNRGGSLLDVVTYCGLSANGVFETVPPNPAPTPLTPRRPFVAPPPSVAGCGNVYASGDAINHPFGDPTNPSGQWDGIVGRLQADHLATVGSIQVTQTFHSIVGGYPDSEGLFGIAELTMDRFAVVGTIMSGVGQASVFPLWRSQWRDTPICLDPTNPYVHGVIAEFDASVVAQPSGILLLEGSALIGATGAAAKTVARDVIAHGGLYYVVGSTTGQDFSINQAGAVGAPSPISNGYLVVTADPRQEFLNGMYFPAKGGSVVSGLVGVAAWSEYPDHVSVLGWVEPADTGTPPVASKDFIVGTVFRDTTSHLPDGRPLTLIRGFAIEAPGEQDTDAIDHDSVVPPGGGFNSGLRALGGGPNFPPYPFRMGAPGGGGLSVDPRGSLTLVGFTDAAAYPVVPAPIMPPPPNPISRDVSTAIGPSAYDAVRSVLDMLPAGVCRSDGSGLCPAPGWSPAGDGGTTPACALSSFGSVLGTTPVLQRMFLDYEGVPEPGLPITLVVDRPPPASWVLVAGWQVGVPAPAPFVWVEHAVELWGTGSAIAPWPILPTGASTRQQFAAVPPGSTYLVQYVCLLAAPMVGTSCPSSATDLTWAASPALFFAY